MKQMMGFLVLLMGIQLVTLGKLILPEAGVGVNTMPILTPLSLEYEQTFRAGEEPANLHLIMDAVRHVNPERVSKAEYEQFVADRQQMLVLRNQRHELNVRLMEAGVALLQTLTPEQWEFVQSQRDAIQAKHEAMSMERLLEKWSE